MNIPILMYHEITENPNNEWCVSIDNFEKQMGFLKKQGFETITLSSLYNNITTNKKLPEKPIIITFDDARLGVYKHAYPILKKLKMKSCLFVVSDWISNKQSVPENEKYSDFMNWDQIKELSENNFEIGSHSKDHSNLTKLSEKDLELNIVESKSIIELKINKNNFSFYFL